MLAALRLLPANANASLRLDALRWRSDALLGFLEDPNWPNVAADAWFPDLRQQEDAPAHPFTDRLVGPRGAATVLPGPVQDAVYALRMLQRGLFLDMHPLPAGERRRLGEFIGAVLAIADGVSRRAELQPFVKPRATHDIEVPDDTTLARLSCAVFWSSADARSIRGAPGALGALSSSPWRPVEPHTGGWLIAAPEYLVPALNDLIVQDFGGRGQREDLQARYDAAVWSSVVESMARLGAAEAITDHGAEGYHGRFAIGNDYVVHGLGVPSDLDEPGATGTRVISTDALLTTVLAQAGPRDVVLAVGQPLVDPYFDNAGHAEGAFPLSMCAADLEVLARLHDSTPMTLLHFARSANEARTRGDVVRFSTLDEYWLYQDMRERHPRGSLDEPIALVVGPGAALPLRLRVARDTSVEAASAPGGGITEVTRRYRGVDLPVYVPPPGFPSPARVVKAGASDIWFIGTSDDETDELQAVLDSLATFAAVATRDHPEALGVVPPVLTVRVVRADLRTFVPDHTNGHTGPPALLAGVDSPNSLRIVFDPSFQAVAHSPDNDADRGLLSVLLAAIRDLQGPGRVDEVGASVDAILPPGRTRMIVAVDQGQNAAIGPPDTPAWRRVAEADRSEWHDALGEAVRQWGYSAGPIEGQRALLDLLSRAVGFLYDCLVEEGRRVAPEGAVAILAERIEALHRVDATSRLGLVSLRSVLGDAAGEVVDRRIDLLNVSRSLTATQFLLEYLAARPPAGTTRLSNLVGDRLCALASVIVDLGSARDAVWLDAFEGEVAIEPSGRIDIVGSAQTTDFTIAYEDHLRRADADAYPHHWVQASDAVDPVADLAAFDKAWIAEFGSSLSDTALFVNAAILYADDHGVSVVEARPSDFIADVAQRRGWDPSRVETILESLTLTSRDDYLGVAPGNRRADVYPWRFGRRLSYLRRPFVIVPDSHGPRLVYGTRHLYLSSQYLLDLISSGRLIARTQSMRDLMGKFARHRSIAFVEEVAAVCQRAGLIVRTGVRKVQGERLGGRAGDLGDIDVVAADLDQGLLWLIECKAVSSARTPWEVGHELREFVGPKGHLARHARRVEWTRHHVHELLSELMIGGAYWTVSGLVVTDAPIPTAYRATRADIPIVEAQRLGDVLQAGKGSPRDNEYTPGNDASGR